MGLDYSAACGLSEGASGRKAPHSATAKRTSETTAFQPAKESPNNRQLASVQLTTLMFLSELRRSAALVVVAVPPPQSAGPAHQAPFGAGLIDGEIEIIGEDQPGHDEEHAHHRRLGAGERGEQGGEHQRQADIIGDALLEAELAGDVAADELKAPGAEDGREAKHQDEGGCCDLAADFALHSQLRSDDIAGDDEAAEDDEQENRRHQGEATLDEIAHRLAIVAQELGDDEET